MQSASEHVPTSRLWQWKSNWKRRFVHNIKAHKSDCKRHMAQNCSPAAENYTNIRNNPFPQRTPQHSCTSASAISATCTAVFSASVIYKTALLQKWIVQNTYFSARLCTSKKLQSSADIWMPNILCGCFRKTPNARQVNIEKNLGKATSHKDFASDASSIFCHMTQKSRRYTLLCIYGLFANEKKITPEFL